MKTAMNTQKNQHPFWKRMRGHIYPLLRPMMFGITNFFFRNTQYSLPLDPGSIRKVLFFRHDVLGDMLNTLPAIRLLKHYFPEIEIHVLCSPSNKQALDFEPSISKVHIVPRDIMLRTLKARKYTRELKKEKYDVIFQCFTSYTSKNGILANMIGVKSTIKVAIYAGEKYRGYYNAQSIPASKAISMWEKLFVLVQDTMGIQNPDPQLQIPIFSTGQQAEMQADQILKQFTLQPYSYVLVNLSTGQPRNQWHIKGYHTTIQTLLDLDIKVLLTHMPAQQEMAQELIQSFPRNVYTIPTGNSLHTVAALAGKALWIFTPDTGMIHLASAMRRPVFGLYRTGEHHEWKPFMIPYYMFFAPPGDPVAAIQGNEVAAQIRLFHEQISQI
jgi:ADP-heptose:LPS heptosyltransferase